MGERKGGKRENGAGHEDEKELNLLSALSLVSSKAVLSLFSTWSHGQFPARAKTEQGISGNI